MIEIVKEKDAYLQRIKLSTIKMKVEFISGVLSIKSYKNTITILHSI